MIEENFTRIEEWSADGSRQYITGYGGANEWLWKKSINHITGCEKLSVNRDSFIFFSVPEDMIRSLEIGKFEPDWLLEIRWEDTREAILGILGATRAVTGLPMQTIDRFGPNRLLQLEWRDRWGAPRMGPWCFLELHCTSATKVSYLRVPPVFTDALSAIAWTFSMDKENYLLDRET